ncbi:MAG: transglutaminase family protein [Rubrivivax sp.]|nr:transglutaminase family protein [Rubrivivax sp.]
MSPDAQTPPASAGRAGPVAAGAPPTPACLAATPLLDSDHPAVIAFARQHAVGQDDRERAVALLYAVRDGFRYDPYRIDLSPRGMCASAVLANGHGWCVPKAALLVAAARAAGIPARAGYADVRNHLSTERMRRTMKTDLFIWHGYADLWLEGRWLKATPAFNIQLCERFGLLPLDFDGRSDSIYHAFDKAGQRHMEYVNQRGAFDDMPLAQIVADFEALYGRWMAGEAAAAPGASEFEQDVRRETAG